MKTPLKSATITMFTVVMALLAFVTLFAMAIGPVGTGISETADTYKITSLLIFVPAFWHFAWRKNSVIAAAAIPVAQMVSGYLFLTYLNGLPMGAFS